MPKSAAEATPPTGNRFVEFDEFIDYQLNKTSKSIQSTDILVGLVGAGLGLTLYLFLFILADHWLVPGGLGPWARLIYWSLGLGALGYWVVTRILKPFNGRVNVLFAARQIERTQPGLKSSLLTLTDLKQAGRPTTGHIRGSLEKRAAVGLSKADVEEAVDRGPLMTSSYAFLFLLAVFCGYALLSPKSILQSAWRAFVPFTSTGVATRTRIDRVNPGSTQVPAQAHLDVEVEVSGHAPQEATLYYTTADGAFVDEALPLRDSGEGLRRYRGTLIGPDGRGLRQNLNYYVVAGDARSDSYSVAVIQSPSAVVDSIDYEYQSYTGLSPKSEPGGAIDGWEGTRVTVHATANQNVKSATVLFSDTEDTSVKAEELPMIIENGTKLRASWQLAFRSDGSFPRFYRVQLKSEEGHEDPLPSLQPLNVRADLPPKVEILSPKSDLQAPVNGVVAIAYRAADPDFKLRSLILNLEHDGQILATSPRLFTGPPDEEAREGTHILRLKDLNLAAGSRLTYWLEARDNFEPFGDRGGNRTLSPRLNIDLVAPQPPAQAAEQEKKAAEEAKDALRESRPDQGEPMGADAAGEKGPDAEPMGSDSKPGDEAAPQEGTPDSRNEQNDPAPRNAEPGQPEGQSTPMPGEQSPNQAQEQKSNGTEQQPGTGNNSPGQPPRDGGKPEAGDSKSGGEQRPEQGNSGGEKGTTGAQQDRSQGQQSGSEGPAPEDTAIKKLLDWSRKQQELEPKRKPAENAQPSNPNDAKPNEQDGSSGEKKPDGSSSPKDSGDPGATGNPDSPMKREEQRAAPQSPEERNGATEKAPAKDDSAPGDQGKKNADAGEPADDPMQKPSASGDKPGTDDQKPAQTTGEESPARPQEKNAEPGTSDAAQSKKPGEPTAQPADPSKAGEPGAKGDTPQKASDPTADQTQNGQPSPMNKQGEPGEQGASPQRQDQKPGTTDSPSKGQETPTGESSDRAQPPVEETNSQQKSGNSTDKPAGRSDEQGTREEGNGDPGSSRPGEGSGQKSPGEGEAGKDGQKSSTGEPSGTGKSDDGDKTSEPGSRKGGEQPGADQKGGDQKGGDQKGGDQKGGDQKGGDQKGGDQKGGDQKGGDQKGGDQKGGDQPGGDQKGGGESGSGQSSQGKPSSQSSAAQGKGGAGGTGSSSEAGAASQGEGAGPESSSAPEPADLENRKKATNLALKRLKETLERGAIDPELQRELGFTDEELRSFMNRLEERLADTGEDNSPQAQARRRQFEQLLKGIDLQTETSKREGTGAGAASQGFGAARKPVPAEYRATEQRYRELLNRKK